MICKDSGKKEVLSIEHSKTLHKILNEGSICIDFKVFMNIYNFSQLYSY